MLKRVSRSRATSQASQLVGAASFSSWSGGKRVPSTFVQICLVGRGRAARGQCVRQSGEDPGPAIFVLETHFVVGNAGVTQGDFGLLSASLQSDVYDGLGALGCFGHPGVLDAMRPRDLQEAAVVRPDAVFVLYRKIK